jgi:tripartite ATP-independent transporter DctM subunit
MGLSLIALIFLLSKKRNYPKDPIPSLRIVLTALKEAIIPLLMPLIMLGGIATGVFTPTEAAAAAAAYALGISLFVYRSVSWKQLPKIFVESMLATAVVTFIISATSGFSFILSFEHSGEQVTSLLSDLTTNRYVILLIMNGLLLLAGALMEAGAVLILFIPVLFPLALSTGIDPVHLGVIMCVNLMIGVATPPIGVCLFVMSHVSGLRVETLARSILPFLIPMLICLVLVTYIPELVLFLPNLWME